jgi:hypothetical protein
LHANGAGACASPQAVVNAQKGGWMSGALLDFGGARVKQAVT